MSAAPGVPTTVDAPAGTIVGRTDAGIRRFLGVPYAEAPFGDRRFALPERRAPFTEPFDAGEAGPTPQRVPLFATTTVPEPSIPGTDTLNVSIVTPELVDGPLPVFVWIHGGGFLAGSAASPWYDGRSFARDGIVTVSISYRLGIDGFAPIPGVPTNLGLRDVILALEWIRDNIAAFGGDPDQVTIGGQSAGGGIVLALLSSPAAEGLFHGAVSVSGGVFTLPAEQMTETVERLAAALAVPATRDGFAGVSDEAAQRAILAGRDLDDDVLSLGPLLGDDILPLPMADGLAVHNLDVPLLLGATGDEFDGEATPENPENGATTAALRAAERAAGTRVTDELFRSAVPLVAAARPEDTTWAYTFEWPSPVMLGSTHCIDIPYFFDVLDSERVTAALGDAPPQALATRMHDDLVGFVTTGAVGWPTAGGVLGDTSALYSADEQVTVVGAYDPVVRGAR